MSELTKHGQKSSATSASSSYSSSSASKSSSSSSSSSKVVKQSTTTMKSSSTTASSSSSTSSSSKTVGIKSSGSSYLDRMASDFGIDSGREVEKLKLKMSEEMSNIHQDMFQLMPINSPDADKTVLLDSDSLKSCIDKAHNDRLKLNFDVNEFESESINIKTVGNKIEVHAKKKSRKGDEERSEEFSRVYELPTQNAVDAGTVSSSIYKDGVLTIELPVADAIAGTDVSLGQTSSAVKSSSSVSSSSISSSTSSKVVGIKSSGLSYLDRISSDFGIDMGQEMEKLKLKMNEEMSNIHQDMFQLMPINSLDADKTIVRLDSDSLKSCIDKAHNDRLKLNFDVNEFESESINIKTVGNKIEVHAKKKSKKGDEERSEEFSRVYELPTQNAVDAGNVTSSIYKDGVLTIELPVADAIAGTDVSLGQTSSAVKSSSSVSSSSTSSSTSSKVVGIKSSGLSYLDRISSDFGIDIGQEMDKLKLKMSEEMSNIHQDMFQLMPINSPDADKTIVRLDSDSLKSCIDKAHSDRLKLNFDVNEFESESINIKTVGNKIEVHAKKKSKKGDEERSEEFSRVYELPTQNAVDAGNVTSSIYKDGVLTIELPVADAIAGTDVSLGQTSSAVKSSSSVSSCTSSSISSSTSSKSVGIKSSGLSYLDRISSDFGIDIGQEMDKLKLKMSEEMSNIHQDMFQLMPINSLDADKAIVRLDSDSLKSCIDKAHNDRLKLNFDVNEFESESINIKTVGNKIEVHAKKKSKKGDEERSEEFSRVYELPTQNAVDAGNVTSSIYKDGVLTIEFPVADAIAGTDVSLGQ